jgi:DNA polymerase IV
LGHCQLWSVIWNTYNLLCLQVKLSCCRSTPADSPNADFISHLHTIRDHRILTSDEVGIRAYSTAIAAIQAYPYPLTSSSEVMLLPGCHIKISALFHSWLCSHTDPKLRTIPDVEKLKLNENLVGLAMLHKIWGVGPETAREWWFVKGWRSVDDVVEYGWKGLTRVQQIGVKYYDDFQKPMPRWEAERIRGVYPAVTMPAISTIPFHTREKKRNKKKQKLAAY